MAGYKDYYDALGVARSASEKEVRAAFRKLAAKHHPDRNPDDPGAEERFKEINEAYTVLSDPEKREVYDQYGTTGDVPPFAQGGGGAYRTVSPEEFAGFSDFFQTLFGGTMGGGFRSGGAGYGDSYGDPFSRAGTQRRAVPRAAEAELRVPLLSAFSGGETTFQVDGKGLTVTLPAGTRDGARLRLRGQAPGGGDLILVVRHKVHPVFSLKGDDVRVLIDVPDYRAVLGGAVRVPTLDGEVEMTIPPHTPAGRVLRLRGQGWPHKGGGRGDELAEIRVRVPTDPSIAQLEHYRELERDAVDADPQAATAVASERVPGAD